MANRKQNEEEVAVEAAESPEPSQDKPKQAASGQKAEPKQASLQEANKGFFAQMRAAMKARAEAEGDNAYRQKRRR